MRQNLITIIFITLLISSASAQKWEIIEFPSDETITGISLISPDSFYLATNTGNIIRTVNKGANWQAVTPLKGVALEDIQFLDNKVGYVCGEKGTVLRTIDGGARWNIANPADSMPHFFDIEMVSIALGFAVGIVSNDISPYEGVFYKTENGGVEWEKLKPDGFGYNEAFHENGNLYLLSFGRINISNDLGLNWKSSITHEGNPGRTITKFGKTVIIAGIKGLVLYSPDEGKNFIPTEQKFEDINFITAELVSEKVGYIGGSKGAIYQTTNGGKTWTLESTPRSFNVLDLEKSDNYIYAVGSEGTIIRRGLIEYKSIQKR